MVNMIAFIFFIQNVIGTNWYDNMKSLCLFTPHFQGKGYDGNDQLYHCREQKSMWRTEKFTSRSSCLQYDGCHLDDTVAVGEVCLAKQCVWTENRCFCSKILDPFSPTNGCEACKYETPSPTFYGECSCTHSTGASVFGIEDSNGVCQCDVNFVEGDNCDGGVGFGLFDSGIVPFVKDSCHWDPNMDFWRQISCNDHHTLRVEWFSDDGCSQSLDALYVQNDTCYYSCGQPISETPTPSPTEKPITKSPTEEPTPNPTMTDAPTLSPIVINDEKCDLDFIRHGLNDYFYAVGDQQWIDDCLNLWSTHTSQLPIVCGCIGKFSKSLANQWFNCILKDPYHGLQVWNLCLGSMYSQSCGSKCTDFLTRRQLQQEVSHSRRRNHCGIGPVADNTFKLLWSEAICGNDASDKPTSSPTKTPSSDPTEILTSDSTSPTNHPTSISTENPSSYPTEDPSRYPTSNPTEKPSSYPTEDPSRYPTSNPTKSTYQPTSGCIEYKTWDEFTARENCPKSQWGLTKKGYGSMIACDSDLQAKLEESAANQLYEQCSSWCIYDYDGLLEGRQAGYIWRKEGCWKAVTKYHCFRGHPYEVFEELLVHTASICQVKLLL